MEDSKNKKTKDDLTYRYFVAFSHSCGFGNIFLTLTKSWIHLKQLIMYLIT